MVSAHNPFRTPAVSPNTTGTEIAAEPSSSSSSSIHSSSSLGRVERPRTPPRPRTPQEAPTTPSPPPPDHAPAVPSQTRPPLPQRHSGPQDDLISEELPPAYTPAPDVIHGETTIELGPRRPFQHPPRLLQPYLSPVPTGWQSSQFPGSSSWSTFPVQSSSGAPAPPPRHPSQRGYSRPTSAPGHNPRPLSEFARDFYEAGAAVPGETGSNSISSTSPQTPDNGRPTEVPTPGHPLLRHGKVLVYPGGYECTKCHNTGYRNNDPSMPCLKCWDKHGRPFSGPVAYMPWDGAPSLSSDNAHTSYQRPLPRFAPPQRAASLSRAQGGYLGAGSRIIPVAGGGIAMSPYLDPLQRPPANIRVTAAPPPGATVVRPGDPRIGGRLCWRCGGSGVTTFLVFDETTCGVCNGVGRTFD